MPDAGYRDICDVTETLDGNAYRRCRFYNVTLVWDGGAFTLHDCQFGDGVRLTYGPRAAEWVTQIGRLLGHDALGPHVAEALDRAAQTGNPTLN